MKTINIKNVTKSALNLTLCLSVALLTACGGDSKKKATAVTTLSCTQNSVFNQSTNIWTLSTTDTRRCNPIQTVGQNGVCNNQNDLRVRVPVTNFNNQNLNNTFSNNQGFVNNNQGFTTNNFSNQGLINNNRLVNSNPNFHLNNSNFSTTCINRNSPDYRFVRQGSGYFYFDVGFALNTWNTGSFNQGNVFSSNQGFVSNNGFQQSGRTSNREIFGTIGGAIVGALIGNAIFSDDNNSRNW